MRWIMTSDKKRPLSGLFLITQSESGAKRFFLVERKTGMCQLVQKLAFPVLQLRIRSYRERNAFSQPSSCLHIRAFIGADLLPENSARLN